LNKELYLIHIENANTWQHNWNNIEESINHKLQEMVKIHQKQHKIHNLTKSQTENITNENNHHPRVINTTDINFTQAEIQLLSKGLKYNLHYRRKNWLETLALEVETAISNLDITEQQYYRHAVAINIKKINTQKNINNKRSKKRMEINNGCKK
jgi:hypothetical protein